MTKEQKDKENTGYETVESSDEGQGDVENGEEMHVSDPPFSIPPALDNEDWIQGKPASIPTPEEEEKIRAEGEVYRLEKELQDARVRAALAGHANEQKAIEIPEVK